MSAARPLPVPLVTRKRPPRRAPFVLLAIAAVVGGGLAFTGRPEPKETRFTPAGYPLKGVLLLGMVEGGRVPDVYRKYKVHIADGRLVLLQKQKINGPYDSRLEMPHRLGGEMRGCEHSPLVPSPDGRYTALCLQRVENDGRSSSREFNNEFEVVDAQSQRKALTAEVPEDRRIDGIFWSPDSRALAVLSTRERIGLGPIDLLMAVTGNPTPMVTTYLDVYDIQSQRHGEIQIRRDAEFGDAKILDWSY